MIVEPQVMILQLNQDTNLQHFFYSLRQQKSNLCQNKGKQSQQKCYQGKSQKWSQISNDDFRDQIYSQPPMRKNYKKAANPKKKFIPKIKKKDKNERLKAYISMLESKVDKLQKEINRLKNINSSNIEYIQKINSSEQIISGCFIRRNQICDRIKALCDQPPTQQIRHQIVNEIDTLRYRLGAHGTDRVKAIDYYFNQVVQSIVPDIQKFLIYAACKNMDCFDTTFLKTGRITIHPKIENEWRLQILKIMNLNEQNRNLIASYHLKIIAEKMKFDELMKQFCETKKALSSQAKNIQNIYDRFREFLNPFQLSKILVNIQKNRFRKQISLQSFWTYDGIQDKFQPETDPFWTHYEAWT